MLAVAAGAITAAGAAFDALAVVSGVAAICRVVSEALGAASFIGVNTAVNAISLLASGAAAGAGAGNSGVLVDCAIFSLEPVAGADGVAAGAADAVGIGTGATIAVRIGRSAKLRNGFFESVATGRAAVGADEGEAPPPNMDWIIASAICAGDAVVCAAVGAGDEELVDPDDSLANIDWIIGLAISAGDAVTGSFDARPVERLVDIDDALPNIERIIESASSAGDAVTTGAFAPIAIGDVA
jgi:hypothetical protein